ncbi:serine hydrolase domain-containing protein [Adhaeribacter pallidiroseus]|uniref:Beta-lactamase n=1 Tax=Adhaeribacter pallidiroseus TaxID=2072847 RepID=A0A369QLS0_9BACT|nr:serine hydrolase domain-containing protein [Adhaeribacter pallidiroseus]RDC65664.1 Beta-lactamase [Adhaeribacter pallidiroseus]
MKTRLLFLISFSLQISFSYAQQLLPETERIQQVENSLMPYVPIKDFPGWNLAERMKHYRVPGLSIAVIRNLKIDWAKSYGLADTTTKMPVTTTTVFSAGSISKLVTAVAALQLVDKKQLTLDSPINNYLTSWKLPDNQYTQNTPITLRYLLSHQAGVSQSSYYGSTPNEAPFPTIIEILNGLPPAESRPVVVNSQPGKEFRYSGGAYLIAQQAIMDMTKKSFTDYTYQNIFKKWGMPHTTFAQPLPVKFQKLASWAYSENSWYKGMPYVYPQQAAAGLYSTPSDLAKLIIQLQKSYQGQSKLLSREIITEMLKPQVAVTKGFYHEDMGLGAFLLQRHDNQNPAGIYFEHTGVNAGFLAYAIGSLTEGNGVVIMMNKDGAADELGKEIRRAVAKVYNWTAFLPDQINPIALATNQLQQYAGRYQRAPDEVVKFRQEKNYLVETINQGNPIYCFPIAPDTIAFSDFPFKGVFRRNNQNQITGVEILGIDKVMPRLANDDLLPNELMQQGRIPEAMAGYRKLQLNENQLTYMAYEFMHQKPAKLKEAEGILQLADERFAQSSIVLARWGDLYQLQGKIKEATAAYQQALKDNPQDKELQQKLSALTR